MGRWFSFARSQDDTTASVTVDIAVDAQHDVPSRPRAFLVVRRIEDGADPQPERQLDERVTRALEDAGMRLVAVLTMSGSRTLIAYGNDSSALEAFAATSDTPLAIQSNDDPAWQLYRTLLPTEEEIARAGSA